MRWTKTAIPMLAALTLLAPDAAGAQPLSATTSLSSAEVQTIIAQGVGRAMQLGVAATVAVTDKEGNALGTFQMTGANPSTTITSPGKPLDPDSLQGLAVPAVLAAVSKAGTAAYLSSEGNAFSSRTLGYLSQEHFPPAVANTEGGPLFGVQYSQLPCSDVVANPLPLGLSGDAGSAAIYKNGLLAGGVGVESDGTYTIDPIDNREEDIAVAATRSFEAPAAIRDPRYPYVVAPQTTGQPPAFPSLPGTVLSPVRATPATRYQTTTVGALTAKFDPRFFPTRAGTGLTAAEVDQILAAALSQASKTLSGVRPEASAAQVAISVVDANGVILGIYSTNDAPIFGFDVSAQKARTAAFFSSAAEDTSLRALGPPITSDAAAARADGIPLNGNIAFSDRALAAISRPFLPDGIDGTANGGFSKPIAIWSPFNLGLQLALSRQAIVDTVTGQQTTACTAIPALRNGVQPLAGGFPLYRNGVLVGAVGVSGDGIDQDDLIAATAASDFPAPAQIRADQLVVRGSRLPY